MKPLLKRGTLLLAFIGSTSAVPQDVGPIEVVTASCTTFHFSGATSVSTHTFTYTSYPTITTLPGGQTPAPVTTITAISC
ncbi:hypothetical protein BDZ94DRAFT_1260451 [Collybia nuda]|uniref:Antifreeze protein n=1 Tax=Collybia nuda TaxID=64659 RepID=A0A9P5Y5W3_9AGAR|nr:hypothetical protein BDZ94DRAFT_1260451 [Collybia nuda]